MTSCPEEAEDDSKDSSSSLIYHETQSSFNLQCLVHAINNLLGDHRVDRTDLDAICDELAAAPEYSSSSKWWSTTTLLSQNPHRSALGLGNYDANVAMVALQRQGLDASFFDGRKTVDELMVLLQSQSDDETASTSLRLQGLLLNVSGKVRIPLINPRHWISYRLVETCWWRLDSKQNGPELIEDLAESMKEHLSAKDHILIVRKSGINMS
jgi:hypothetical protein